MCVNVIQITAVTQRGFRTAVFRAGLMIQITPLTQCGFRTAVFLAGLMIVISDFEPRKRGQAAMVATWCILDLL